MGHDSNKKISRFLCVLLRHDPSAGGITVNEHGWANAEELIACVAKKRAFTRADLEKIVRTDDKGRYSFSADGKYIRANHGHTIKVDLELDPSDPPEYLWHGTGDRHVKDIDQKGLLKMARQYVHMTTSIDMAMSVGARHGRPVLYRVHSGAMARDGYVFRESASHIWLTDHVPVGYLEKMEEQ